MKLKELFTKYMCNDTTDIYRIDEFKNVVKLVEHVYTFLINPEEAEDFKLDSLENLMEQYSTKKRSGWCYENAMFLHLLLNQYNRPSLVYNYGINGTRMSHAIVLVEFNRKYYPVDPYFCKYFRDNNYNILDFDNLIKLINNSEFEKILPVYGESKKQIYVNGSFVNMKGFDFEKQIMKDWVDNFDYVNIMDKEYGSINPLNLMKSKLNYTRLLRKISGDFYFEFF